MRRRYATIESEAALRELSELAYSESMIPIRAEDKFAFQLTFHGRNKLIKTSDPEILLLKHARYILENADRLKKTQTKEKRSDTSTRSRSYGKAKRRRSKNYEVVGMS